jgi:hypothetical protein
LVKFADKLGLAKLYGALSRKLWIIREVRNLLFPELSYRYSYNMELILPWCEEVTTMAMSWKSQHSK